MSYLKIKKFPVFIGQGSTKKTVSKVQQAVEFTKTVTGLCTNKKVQTGREHNFTWFYTKEIPLFVPLASKSRVSQSSVPFYGIIFFSDKNAEATVST